MDAHSKYSDFPVFIQVKIASLETELDAIWPGWRAKARFDKCTYDLKARIKWCLKRHSLLTTREGGHPAPKDWDVLVVRDGQNASKCYAHPVLPKPGEELVSRNPPRPLITVQSTQAT